MYKEKITKEELNELPIGSFNGKIVVVETENQLEEALKHINSSAIVGIDTETRPAFVRGKSYKVALLQVACLDDVCYLIRLNKLGLTDTIAAFLSSPKVIKIGLSLKDDFLSLRRVKRMNLDGFIDIQKIISQYGILDLSLQKIYAIIFEKRISKSQRLSNWEQDKLTGAQQKYAATDAWACLEIYNALQHSPKISPKTPSKKIKETSIN